MTWLTAALCLVLPLMAGIDPDLPSPAPSVRSVFPPGAQRGTTVEVELTGQNLHDTRSVEFAGSGVQAEVLPALASKVRLKITVAPKAEVGHRDYRLTTDRGVYVGAFDIGALPEIIEKEGNDDWRKPQPIELPVLVNGTLGSEDWDHFSFRAKAGQRLIFDVSATRYGSRLDSDIALLNDRGNELAWVDDTTIFGDPHLEHVFESEGEYVLRVGSLSGGGTYRLSAGALPYVARTFPAGLSVGTPAVLTFSGTILDQVDEVWLGDRLAKGQILSKSSGEIRARFVVPKSVAEGRSRVHLSAAGRELAMPTEVRISRLPEIVASTPAYNWKQAQLIPGSAVLNGVIDQPKATHFFRIQASAGDTFLVRAESMKLGYHLDPTITVLDGQGKKVAYVDDPGGDDRSDEFQLDPDLSFRCEKKGAYYIGIRDGMYRGGEQLLYRLTVLKQPPDFIVEVRESLKTLYAGQEDTIQVRVRRRSGWDAPVEVWAEGLPDGVTAERRVAEPKDSVVKDTCGVDRVIDGSIVLLPVRAGEKAQGIFDFKVMGRGVVDGRTVEHEAVVRYNHATVGHLYGPMQVQRAQLAVTKPPSLLLSVPDTVTLDTESRAVRVGIRRFGQAKESSFVLRPKSLPDGVKATPQKVTAEAKEITVEIAGKVARPGARVVFEAIPAHGGPPIAETPPIEIEPGK